MLTSARFWACGGSYVDEISFHNLPIYMYQAVVLLAWRNSIADQKNYTEPRFDVEQSKCFEQSRQSRCFLHIH